jgi:hypothetical protein
MTSTKNDWWSAHVEAVIFRILKRARDNPDFEIRVGIHERHPDHSIGDHAKAAGAVVTMRDRQYEYLLAVTEAGDLKAGQRQRNTADTWLGLAARRPVHAIVTMHRHKTPGPLQQVLAYMGARLSEQPRLRPRPRDRHEQELADMLRAAFAFFRVDVMALLAAEMPRFNDDTYEMIVATSSNTGGLTEAHRIFLRNDLGRAHSQRDLTLQVRSHRTARQTGTDYDAYEIDGDDISPPSI